MNVLDTVCVDHGHALLRVQPERNEHVLAISYEGCDCRRHFRGLRSYSPTNLGLINQFYETDDLDSVLEAVKAVHTVAIELSDASLNDETVDDSHIRHMASIAAKDAEIAAAYAVSSELIGTHVDEIERTAASVLVLQRHLADLQHTAMSRNRATATVEARISGVALQCRLCHEGICWNKASYGHHTVCDQCVQRLIRDADAAASADAASAAVECGVCYNMCRNETPCGHAVCKRCVENWKRVCNTTGRSVSCPYCRAPL